MDVLKSSVLGPKISDIELVVNEGSLFAMDDDE